jgi:hypothetical protein
MQRVRVAWTGLVVVVGATALPWGSPAPASAGTSLPHAGSVVDGRYTGTVRLDQGVVTVSPPRGRPGLSEQLARHEFLADAELTGYRQVAFGLGAVSISAQVPGARGVTLRQAWVGFARTVAVYHCPASPPGAVPPVATPPSNGYAAFVVGAAHGAPAVTYVAQSVRCNNLAPASLDPASEQISIPWHSTGGSVQGALELQATLPPCGHFSGLTSAGSATSMTITLIALVPDRAAHCQGPTHLTEKDQLNPPVGPGAPPGVVTSQTRIRHGRLGPVTQVRPG